jgi:hypothetical protein
MAKDPIKGRQLAAWAVVVWIVSVLAFLGDYASISGLLFLVACLMLGFAVLLGLGRTIEGADRKGDLRPCPVCAEPIRTQAIKCRFCGADL